MVHETQDPLVRGMLALRVASMGLCLGICVFAGVVVALLAVNPPPPANFGLPFSPAAMGLGFCLAAVPVSLFLRDALLQIPPAHAGTDAIFARFRVTTLVPLAVCDGGGFALLVLVLLSGPTYVYWVAGILAPLAGMALHFPTDLKYAQYKDEHMRNTG